MQIYILIFYRANISRVILNISLTHYILASYISPKKYFQKNARKICTVKKTCIYLHCQPKQKKTMKTNNTLKGFYTSNSEQGSYYLISAADRDNKRVAALILSSLISRHNVRTLICALDPFGGCQDISRYRDWRVWRNLVSAVTATCPVIAIIEDRANHKIIVNVRTRDARRGQMVANQILFE